MIKDLIIYILFIIIIILYKNKENFINTSEYTLTEFINNDKTAITNILNFTNNFIKNNDSYNINKNIIVNDLNINNNCVIDGNLNITNNLSFNFSSNQINNIFLDILPRWSIINFDNNTLPIILPKRWVVCDGKKWYINKENDNDIKGYIIGTEPNNIDNKYEVIVVPDLRGRFLFGASDKYKFKDQGGKDKAIIKPEHLPNHYHPTNIVRNRDEQNFKYAKNMPFNGNWLDIDYDDDSGQYILDTNKYGNIGADNLNNVTPHENMPPYLVTRYIIKI